jgi:hypothetical protein
MTEVLKINSFTPLNLNEMHEINGGGALEAIAVGLLAVGTIALTIAFPPAGVAVTTAICVGEGIAGVAGVVLAAKN